MNTQCEIHGVFNCDSCGGRGREVDLTDFERITQILDELERLEHPPVEHIKRLIAALREAVDSNRFAINYLNGHGEVKLCNYIRQTDQKILEHLEGKK